MRKTVASVGLCFLAAAVCWCGSLIFQRQQLREELIRLHVVANSDSQNDQLNKLRVRDAVTESLREELQNLQDVTQAKQYLQEKLPYIQSVAEHTLKALGCEDSVAVSLCRESFGTRVYDTFTLPSGVYNSLRIIIGEGEGKNWWCVVYPTFCLPAASEEFEDVAAAAGFSESLSSTLSGEEGYELRFGILDLMGKLENILFAG